MTSAGHLSMSRPSSSDGLIWLAGESSPSLKRRRTTVLFFPAAKRVSSASSSRRSAQRSMGTQVRPGARAACLTAQAHAPRLEAKPLRCAASRVPVAQPGRRRSALRSHGRFNYITPEPDGHLCTMKENLDWRGQGPRPSCHPPPPAPLSLVLRPPRSPPSQPARGPSGARRYNFTEFNKAVFVVNVMTLALMLSAQSYFWRAPLHRPTPPPDGDKAHGLPSPSPAPPRASPRPAAAQEARGVVR